MFQDVSGLLKDKGRRTFRGYSSNEFAACEPQFQAQADDEVGSAYPVLWGMLEDSNKSCDWSALNRGLTCDPPHTACGPL